MEHQSTSVSTPTGPTGFGGLGIHQRLLESLQTLRFTNPTPIQYKTIPAALTGEDVIGIAQTGTGKTLAFGIPMIQRLAALPGKRGLVVLPTRELALQVEGALQQLARGFGLKTAVLIGGASMGLQLKNLRNNPHIIIATPGRLNDHLTQKTLHLANVAILVLDEADHMFDMGFAPQIKKILMALPQERQTMLFSATMPPEILSIASQNMRQPLRFEVAPQGTIAEKVTHQLFMVHREQRLALLQSVLSSMQGNALVFLRTKHNAKKVCSNLVAAGIPAAELHSNRSLNQRKAALEGFKQGKFRVLVATDIASRGIDVKGLGLVVNYDLPESPSDYVHRIGRTGRAGMVGKAVSFVMPDQKGKIRDIERLIRTTIPVLPLPELPKIAIHVSQKPYVHSHYQPYRSHKKSRSFSSSRSRR